MTNQRTPESIMQDLAALRGRPVLCLLHDQSKDEGIEEGCSRRVYRLLNDFGRIDSLCVVIDSLGGDIDEAYRITRAIRENAQDVEVLVPYKAKSAATLVCIGADRIFLGPTGEMGPLDVQLPDPADGQRYRSALETFQGLAQLQTYSLQVLDELIRYFRDGEELDAPYCYERAEASFEAIVSPLFQQVDPHELGELGRYQAISEEYTTRIMKRWSYRDLEEGELERIARRMVWEYPSHEFVIDLHEAQEIGLRAERLDSEAELLCQELINASPSLIDVSPPTVAVDNAPTVDDITGE